MEPITFKYYPVDDNGRPYGFFASNGTLDENELVLDTVVLPLGCIYQVVHRYDRLTIVYAADNGQQAIYTIAPSGGMDRKLKQTMDRLCSYRWADERRKLLEKEGKGAAFRTARCPACTAVVDLSGFAETPQFYCPFCEMILPADENVEPNWLQYKLCDRCRFYGQSTRYTTAYIILNMISWREHYSCHVCMRWECWKMLMINLLPPFIGEVWAIYNTIRAYGAGMMDSYLPELVKANALGLKGRVEEAQELYETMLARVQAQAGLRYNLAMACAQALRWEECVDAALATLRDCSNYTPAGTLLGQALTNRQRVDEAEAFFRTWGMPPELAAPPTVGSEQIQPLARGESDKGIRASEPEA